MIEAVTEPALRRAILRHCRAVLTAKLHGVPVPPPPVELSAAGNEPRALFVTLRKNGDLRGCIGHVTPRFALPEAVAAVSISSAFRDARFPPLREEELSAVTIEVSLLTAPHPVSSPGEIEIGRDGIVLTVGHRSALFLPQVAEEQGWDLDTTLSMLARKAGLDPDAWRRSDAAFETFTAEHFAEGEDW